MRGVSIQITRPLFPKKAGFAVALELNSRTPELTAELANGAFSHAFKPNHGELEEGSVRGRMRDGFVRLAQLEIGDLVLSQIEEAGSNERDESCARVPWEHPLAADCNAIPHESTDTAMRDRRRRACRRRP